MIVKNITLYNYRLYYGENTIRFKEKDGKNIFLITGENGFGKTTFLHSLLWCLFGKFISEIDEETRKEFMNIGYPKVQKSSLNIHAREKVDETDADTVTRIRKSGYEVSDKLIKDNAQYHVSIEFSDVMIPSVPCNSLKITRSYDYITEKESVEILIDGHANELTMEIGPDVFINDFVLNRDIAQFFFFDSERIVSLAETKTKAERQKLNSAYNEVLGVKKYEDLKNNLENLRLRLRRKSSDIDGRNKLEALLKKKESLQRSLEKGNENSQELSANLDNLRRQNEEYQVRLMREGSKMTIDELKKLETLRDVTKTKDIEYKKSIKTFLEYAPFAMTGKLLNQAKAQVENDYKILKSKKNAENQNEIVGNLTKDFALMLSNVEIPLETRNMLVEQLDGIRERYMTEGISGEQLLEMDKSQYNEIMSIYNNIISTYKMEFERLADDYKKNKQILDRTSRKISSMQIDESDDLIKSIRLKKNEIEGEIKKIESRLRNIHENIGSTNAEYIKISKEIATLSKRVSLNDKDVKKDELAGQLISELNVFLASLREQKKDSLERRIKGILNSLMHKEDFVGSVEVVSTENDMDIRLFNIAGVEISKDSLSKGEQQLYATALLKALVDESGVQFPVFIDSPLQKFDKSHANKIIQEFYPHISKQVILFPLLYKEITPVELDAMKPLVNAAYFIKNDNGRSYFEHTDVERLMK